MDVLAIADSTPTPFIPYMIVGCLITVLVVFWIVYNKNRNKRLLAQLKQEQIKTAVESDKVVAGKDNMPQYIPIKTLVELLDKLRLEKIIYPRIFNSKQKCQH